MIGNNIEKENNSFENISKIAMDNLDIESNNNNSEKKKEKVQNSNNINNEILTNEFHKKDNIHKNKSRSEGGYLIDNFLMKKDTNKINEIIENFKEIKDSPPQEELLELIKKNEKFFNKNNYILTKGSIERLAMLIHYIECKNPVLLEGPTGASKTFTTKIALEFLKYIGNQNKENTEKYELKYFNLSQETQFDDLIAKYVSDLSCFSRLKLVNGTFLEAYKYGYPILLDEINLASKNVLQSIQEAIGSESLSVETQGKKLEEIKKHSNFCLIATQNPNKGNYKNKRQELGIEFLSRFTKIYFDLDKEELKKIGIGIGRKFGYEKEDIINSLVDFHLKWVNQYSSDDDIQCFTIREIISTIKSLAKGYSINDCLMTIYGARFKNEMKKKLINEIKIFFPFQLDEKFLIQIKMNNFPFCFLSDITEKVIKQILFCLENGRHVILTGEIESGKTQIAKWCAEYYDTINKIQKSRDKSFCFCTNSIRCSDLIGSQKPSPNIYNGKEMINWNPGFVTEAVQNGGCIVLDNINQAPSIITERLNSLVDINLDKNEPKDEFFAIPENPNKSKILINKTFRIICTCEYGQLNKMTPAFVK